MKRLALALLLLAPACGGIPQPETICVEAATDEKDPKVDSYLAEGLWYWLTEYEVTGTEQLAPGSECDTMVGFRSETGYEWNENSAVTRQYGIGGMPHIYIRESLWSGLTSRQKTVVLQHELGHALLDLYDEDEGYEVMSYKWMRKQ